MSAISKLLIVASFIAICPTLTAQNQCAQPSLFQVPCYAQGCQQTVTITVPQSSAYGTLFGPGFVSCCGGNITTYYPIGGQCLIAKLKDPEVIKRLVDVTSTQTVLVANCKGQYEPFHQSSLPARQAKEWTPASLTEKIVWSAQ